MRYAVLALGALLYAPTAETLARAPQVGETTVYSVKMETEFEGQNLIFNSQATDKISEVNLDGSFTIHSTQDSATVIFDGNTIAGPEVEPTFTSFDKFGKVTNLAGGMAGDADAVRLARLTNIVFPESGEAEMEKGWEATLKANEDEGLPMTKITMTLEGKDTIREHTAYRIAFAAEEMDGSFPAKANGKIWVDARTGAQLQADLKMSNAPLAGNRLDLTLTVRLAAAD